MSQHALWAEQMARQNCQRCDLGQTRQRLVLYRGNPAAPLVLLGEAPGETEERLGRVFVGRAGQLLDRLLQGAGIPLEQVYCLNAVKCRPPGNRTPTWQEIQACRPYLWEQFALLRPQVVVTLGKVALQALDLFTGTALTPHIGQWRSWIAPGGPVPVLPLYHPAYLLRQGETHASWRQCREALQEVRRLLIQKGNSCVL